MKILFADDHPLLLDGLQSAILRKFPGTEVLTALTKKSLYDQLQNHAPDVLIQDVKFGEHHAGDFLAELKIICPGLKILILSSVSESTAIHMLMQRADGYVIKSEPVELIFEAIQALLDGQKFLSPEAKQKTQTRSTADSIVLTKREREVLEIIMQEKSIREIAGLLNISEKTVEMHRSNLFIKLDVKNLAGLVKRTIELHLLEN